MTSEELRPDKNIQSSKRNNNNKLKDKQPKIKEWK